jgi:hypothetical protein
MSASSSRPNTRLLIHPGYHKTGTTWFQNTLFTPRFGYRPLMTHEEVFAALVRPHGLTFDAAAVRETIAGRRGGGEAGAVDVISSEILSGNPFYGGRESDLYAERLKAVAPDARILLTIREQTRALTSIYMQYLSRAGVLPPDRFFADEPVMGYFTFAPEHYEYHRLVRLYCDLFGRENVYVVTQEALARDPKKVAADLNAFAGGSGDFDLADLPTRPVAPSYPEGAAPVLRWINHFRAGPMGNGMDMKGVSTLAYKAVGSLSRNSPARDMRPITRHVLQRFEGRFVESNRELKALMGDRIDLTGYPM